MSNVIHAEKIAKRFGNFQAVSNICLEVPKGQIYGFLGPNGSGKSTIIRMLTGLMAPSSGKLKVLDYELPANSEPLKYQIGYMTQKFSLYGNLTIRENLNFMAKIFFKRYREQSRHISQALSEYALEDIANRMVETLSGGQKQRLALASATLHQSPLLFLDEPTSAVDPESRRQFWQKLYQLSSQGTSILVSTHFMDEAERCHQLAIMESGEIRVKGTPQSLMQDLPFQIIEVSSENLQALITSLSPHYAFTQIGQRLRVRVDKICTDPIAKLRQHLTQDSIELKQTSPNLEDVFVCHTGKGRQ